MALTATQTTSSFSVWGILAAPFVALGKGLVAMGEANSRAREVEFLHSLSNRELADRGLARDDIAHHVFKDAFYL